MSSTVPLLPQYAFVSWTERVLLCLFPFLSVFFILFPSLFRTPSSHFPDALYFLLLSLFFCCLFPFFSAFFVLFLSLFRTSSSHFPDALYFLLLPLLFCSYLYVLVIFHGVHPRVCYEMKNYKCFYFYAYVPAQRLLKCAPSFLLSVCKHETTLEWLRPIFIEFDLEILVNTLSNFGLNRTKPTNTYGNLMRFCRHLEANSRVPLLIFVRGKYSLNERFQRNETHVLWSV